MNEITLYPEKVDMPISNSIIIPFDKLSYMGITLESLSTFGKTGLYTVTIPSAGTLTSFKDGSGFMGTVLDNNGRIVSQARLNPLTFNPGPLFTGIALMTIDIKLDKIHRVQQEILNYSKLKDRSEIVGSIKFLYELVSEFQFKWNDQSFKNASFVKVLDIKQESTKYVYFYKERLYKQNLEKKPLLKSQFTKNMEDITEMLQNLKASIFLYSFSSFAEIILLKDFNIDYTTKVANMINDLSYQYKELYTDCYNRLESDYSSLMSSVISNVINSSNKVEKEGASLKKLTEYSSSEVLYFSDIINKFNNLFNKDLVINFDDRNIYLNAS